jgi:hypothetical protein
LLYFFFASTIHGFYVVLCFSFFYCCLHCKISSFAIWNFTFFSFVFETTSNILCCYIQQPFIVAPNIIYFFIFFLVSLFCLLNFSFLLFTLLLSTCSCVICLLFVVCCYVYNEFDNVVNWYDVSDNYCNKLHKLNILWIKNTKQHWNHITNVRILVFASIYFAWIQNYVDSMCCLMIWITKWSLKILLSFQSCFELNLMKIARLITFVWLKQHCLRLKRSFHIKRHQI